MTFAQTSGGERRTRRKPATRPCKFRPARSRRLRRPWQLCRNPGILRQLDRRRQYHHRYHQLFQLTGLPCQRSAGHYDGQGAAARHRLPAQRHRQIPDRVYPAWQPCAGRTELPGLRLPAAAPGQPWLHRRRRRSGFPQRRVRRNGRARHRPAAPHAVVAQVEHDLRQPVLQQGRHEQDRPGRPLARRRGDHGGQGLEHPALVQPDHRAGLLQVQHQRAVFGRADRQVPLDGHRSEDAIAVLCRPCQSARPVALNADRAGRHRLRDAARHAATKTSASSMARTSTSARSAPLWARRPTSKRHTW